MERVTKKDERGYYLAGDGIYSDWGVPEKFRGDYVDRLAAYEATGMEPEEITAIAGLASENCAKAADKIDQLLSEDKELEQYRALGSIDRLRELAQLDREGRCVVLPCKVGDTVYLVNWFGVTKHIVCRMIDPYFYADDARGFTLKDFGKTVFLACEEAKAAFNGFLL